MRTEEEKVASLHERMTALRQTRERRKTRTIGALGAVLALCLVLLVFDGGIGRENSTVGSYSGSMLFENAGGYVLTAVISFMAGMAATLLCLRQRHRGSRSAQPQASTEDKQEKDPTH